MVSGVPTRSAPKAKERPPFAKNGIGRPPLMKNQVGKPPGPGHQKGAGTRRVPCRRCPIEMKLSENWDTLFWGPYIEDPTI